MKSHLFRMKYLLAGIYIICVIFTCFNARFYHTPLAKISSVTEKETMSRKGTRDAEEYYYTQKIIARILNGTIKGKRFLFLMNIHRLRFRIRNITKETRSF